MKLAASALNLIAVGMIGIGVTTPLVALSLGAAPIGNVTVWALAPVPILWLVCAFLIHLMGQWALGRLE